MSVKAIEQTIPPPWPHQIAGIEWALSHRAAYLDVRMGGGKSRMVVDYLDALGAMAVLVICPKAVVGDVWPREFPKWSGRDWDVVAWTEIGASTEVRLRRAKERKKKAGFEQRPIALVLNYDALRSPAVEDYLRSQKWAAAIYDEAQKLKSPKGKTSMAAARISRSIERALALSGTPLPHSPLDAFAQFRALDPSILGTSWWRFRNRYAMLGGYQGKAVIGYQNQDELTARMAQIMFSPPRGSVDLGLPEAQHIEVKVELSPKAKKLYTALARGVASGMEEGSINAANGLVKLLRMQQLASGLAVVDTPVDEDASDEEIARILRGEVEAEREEIAVCDAKQEALQTLIEGTDEPFVVFGVFRRDAQIARIAAEKAGASFAELSGQADELALWKRGERRVLFVQIASGAEGIDLTRSCYFAYLSTGFDMGRYLQSLARGHRPGQDRKVSFFHVRAVGTVDQYVARALEKREDLILSTLAQVAAAHATGA